MYLIPSNGQESFSTELITWSVLIHILPGLIVMKATMVS